MHPGRKPVAYQNEASPFSGHQIVRTFGKPGIVKLRAGIAEVGDDTTQNAVVCGSSQLFRQLHRKGGNLRRRTTKTVIRHPAGRRETVLDSVKPVHSVDRPTHTPATTEIPYALQGLFGAQKIAVERNDDIGVRKCRLDRDIRTEERGDGRVAFFETERFVGVKLDLRKLLLQRTQNAIASR